MVGEIMDVKWVTVKKLEELTGYTDDAIRGKIKKGVWLMGKHWRKAPDNRVLMNFQEIQAWVEGKAA